MRRCYCCHPTRSSIIRTFHLPAEDGGTQGTVRLFGSCPFRTVEIRELADNAGDPASACLDAITAWVRRELIPCRHEPIWVEYSPSMSLLAVVQEAAVVSARHELWQSQGRWYRAPLPREQYRALLSLSRIPRQRHLSGGGPQPW